MKITLISFGVMVSQTHASNFEFGDKETTAGSIKLSGFLRAKIQDKDYSKNDHSLKFDTAKINLDYENQLIKGHMEYRCYQFDKICDFSTLVDGWLSYDFNEKYEIKVGVQSLPFGPSRFWESNYFGGINTQVGIEDIHNLGVNYQFKPSQSTSIELAYFPKDGGKYHGSNGEAARYTANLIKSNQAEHTNLQEKDMWVSRINQEVDLFNSDHLKTSFGGSYWYSTIENKNLNLDGNRKAWSLFSQVSYDDLKLMITAGKNDINSKDTVYPNQSTYGSFDDKYMVANEGNFYTIDLSYTFKDVYKGLNILPYAMYSTYSKGYSDANNSTRSVIGSSFDYKNFSFVSEYIIGKNDPLVGGGFDSLAEGSANKNNRLLNLSILYFF
ncbi:hypothetical protein B9T33_13120 [Acinetobacter sp. ANC 5054]|nr:hypothetical protein B9T33_13120 [Acinetobacter sp. ANC 5054]